jgi:hypothetical protein
VGPSFEDEDDLLDPGPELVSEEAGLRELESRLDKLKQPAGGNTLFARGVGLVTSLGFVLAGCIVGGMYLGNLMAVRFDNQLFTILGVLLGLAAAITASVKLLKPFLKSEE